LWRRHRFCSHDLPQLQVTPILNKRLLWQSGKEFQSRLIVTVAVLKSSKWEFALQMSAALLLFTFFSRTEPARAAEQDEAAGFFDYLPAVPELKLPHISIPFWTSDLKKARNAYSDGNYDKALKYFRRESDDGNVVADWYLGHMYRLGQGVSRDASVAYTYYSRVAESYDPEESDNKRLRIVIDSQIRMADYRRLGIPASGMKADPAVAARTYLRIASTYGHPAAQFALGEMDMVGEGVTKNPQQGLKWLTAAARKRHPEAQAYLGDLYWDGRNVKKNETRALMWYILAMETSKPEDNPAIAERYHQLVSSLDEDTRLEAEARARVWSEQYPASLNN
jgi:uncharacterized protein